MTWESKQKGFTIVELLIVVVVIAILAAITIVAYNGIQNRAKNSAAQSAASQAGKKVASAAVLNAELYPTVAELPGATGFTSSTDNSTPYQYTVSTDQKTFCLTVTTSGISYYVRNTNLTPTKGACPGHGADGATIISNLITNPSLETNSTGWSMHAGITPSGSDGGRISSGGKWVYQGTRNSTGAVAMYISQSTPITVQANTIYTASVLVTSSTAQSYSVQLRPGGTTNVINSPAPDPMPVAANTPTRIYSSTNTGSNTSVYVTLYAASTASGGTGAIGDVITADEAMLTAGSTVYPYADGATANWVWNGTPHASSSTGPTTP